MTRLLVYLFDLVVAVFLWWLLSRVLARVFGTPKIDSRHVPGNPQRGQPQRTIQSEMARDPVCGMFVSTELSHRLRKDGQTLHFCSRECLERYQKNLKSA